MFSEECLALHSTDFANYISHTVVLLTEQMFEYTYNYAYCTHFLNSQCKDIVPFEFRGVEA
jgi:hypothetical protein